MAFSDQRQFLVSVAGIAGSFWAQLSGGDISVPSTKAYDGGNPIAQILTGNPSVDDLVLSTNNDPDSDCQHAQPLKAPRKAGTPYPTPIQQDPTDPGYKPTGAPPDTWSGTLTKVTTPKTDSMKTGASAATIALTFTCTSVS